MAPKYTRPAAPVTAAWPSGPAYQAEVATQSQKQLADIHWREFFVDPQLQRVIELALANNRDLRVAALTIEKTRAMYQIQRAALFPQIDASVAGSVQRVPADLSTAGQAVIARQYSVGLGVSAYELDFFGRVRSLKDQALEQFLATEQARSVVQISLVAEVANSWLTLAANRERLQLAKDTLESQQASYTLIRHRFEAGASSQLDLRQAQTRVDSARVDIALFTAQLAQSENALNLLVGKPVPPELLPTKLGSITALKELTPGLPSDVLLRRPDILLAEHSLKGANANIGAARAAFFPRITLSSSIGTASAKLTDLFQSGSAAWSFVPQISVPLFDAGSNQANLDVAKADRDIAVAQ
jgi:multidrug efflux system outer membrane protein